MLLKEWIDKNKDIFNESDLRFLLKNVLVSPSSLLLARNKSIKLKELKKLSSVKKEYIKGRPLSYILKKEEFFGHEFFINSDVLVPRKETELLVEEALILIQDNNLKNVLDLGTGSANIAVSIKKLLGNKINIVSSDIDFKALKVASINRGKHSVDINFVNSDLFTSFKKRSFDLIVANPPYVETGNLSGPLLYEPRIALEGGRDGLDVVKRILFEAAKYLKRGGFLVSEFGYAHKDMCEEIISSIKNYKAVKWIKDYAGHFRGVVIKNG
ncbi:MAG: peptide chain release factor N(5)-glutamine methyltransferase [Candidatus Omnitrophica bacterium]|nr:peptide chain release factor N(5)-glutamine methyltransferase [Candidatus Omnitrophota bacterium]MBD3269222.1 peptide chain release factor N(5)-glutamine methyltransferase [Candidatus Omnitrophota bacterium]